MPVEFGDIAGYEMNFVTVPAYPERLLSLPVFQYGGCNHRNSRICINIPIAYQADIIVSLHDPFFISEIDITSELVPVQNKSPGNVQHLETDPGYPQKPSAVII